MVSGGVLIVFELVVLGLACWRVGLVVVAIVCVGIVWCGWRFVALTSSVFVVWVVPCGLGL